MTPLTALLLGLVAGYCVGPLYMFLQQLTKSLESEAEVNTKEPLYLEICSVCKGRCTVRQPNGHRVECVACGGGGYEITSPPSVE